MAPQKKQVSPITAEELTSLLSQKDELVQALKWVRMLTDYVERTEVDLIARLKNGSAVDPAFECSLLKSARRSIAWRDQFVRHVKNGEAKAKRILAATKPTVHLELAVTRKDAKENDLQEAA